MRLISPHQFWQYDKKQIYNYNLNMYLKNIIDKNCHFSQIIINDIENNEICLIINGTGYLIKMPKSKVNLIHEIVKNEIVRNCGSTYIVNDEILKAIEKLPLGKNKNGDDRKATWIARQFQISISTVYQAQKILREGSKKILQDVRSGEMAIKTAYKLITSKNSNVKKPLHKRQKSQPRPKEKKQ